MARRENVFFGKLQTSRNKMVEEVAGCVLKKAYGTSNGGMTCVFEVTNVALPAIAGGADLGLGVKLASFPAGKRIQVLGAAMDLAIQQTEGNIDADTPDVGMGTTIASGEVAVLGGTAAFENIIDGQTATDCDGTATEYVDVRGLGILQAGGHDVYFNVADGWAASGDAGALVSGTFSITYAVHEE